MINPNSSNSILVLASAIREQSHKIMLECLERHGVTDILPAHGSVIYALLVQSPLQMTEIADIIGKKKNTVTSLINTLESRGYCRRETYAKDARIQLVHLTEKGRALRKVQTEIAAKLIDSAWRGVDEESKDVCLGILQTVLHNLTHANTDGKYKKNAKAVKKQ